MIGAIACFIPLPCLPTDGSRKGGAEMGPGVVGPDVACLSLAVKQTPTTSVCVGASAPERSVAVVGPDVARPSLEVIRNAVCKRAA